MHVKTPANYSNILNHAKAIESPIFLHLFRVSCKVLGFETSRFPSNFVRTISFSHSPIPKKTNL